MQFTIRDSLPYLMLVIIISTICSCRNRCSDPVPTMWRADDIEGIKITKDNPNASLREISVSWQQKPPFYAGPMPIAYTSYVFEMLPPEMAMGMGGIVVEDKFKDFS